ncbi:pitrilysin family protein [Alienimonas chondri]|uniref:Zinc protease n=1 Tax=Alienimonas chondri TaxID=2681879 RepID=A0ABX1VIX7_9PLAN|nr:pitrilysin family protein [Alienimonas chondri]NNJ28046.1 putative zinc protease [Alienimonas chondri]
MPAPSPSLPSPTAAARPATQHRTLANGLTVLVEPMNRVRSAAFSLMVPAGSSHDPPGKNACAAMLCDLLTRGSGDLDNRGFTHALDDLGVNRGESVGASHLSVSASTVAENLPQALRIYRDLFRSPHLPEDEFAPAADGLRQSLRAIEDEPAHRVMLELRRRTYPTPWGLPTDGTLAGLDALTHADVVNHHRTAVRPNNAILAVAGHVDADEWFDLAAECFEDWEERPTPTIETGPRGPARDHLDHDGAQTHIALALPAAAYGEAGYYEAWAAAAILGGGMSSRLFTEVREKRGLCYSVSASLSGLKAGPGADAAREGRLFCYAGTTAERAQQTLDVLMEELWSLRDGVTEGELTRCVARAKSGLVMSQESTTARASSLARDWHHLGRLQPLSETLEAVEALTAETVSQYLASRPAAPPTALTLGPAALAWPE